MNNICGVRFKENGKIYFFNARDFEVGENDFVIVETEKGLQIAKVLMTKIINKSSNSEIKDIIRVASNKDISIYKKNQKDALQALDQAKKIAKKLELNMNLIEANYTFDRKQLVFFFLADSRIDFREMAKELASIYKTRIELRQLGIRDKAKEVSGIGQCGRELCCSCFLKDSMETVSINMAKNQNISLNPNKINGQCGRLLCCLNYEDELYSELREGMPNLGDEITHDNRKGKVVALDILKRSYVFEADGERIEVKL